MYHIIWFLELPNFHFFKGHFRFGLLYPCLNYCAVLYLMMSTLIGIFAQFDSIVNCNSGNRNEFVQYEKWSTTKLTLLLKLSVFHCVFSARFKQLNYIFWWSFFFKLFFSIDFFLSTTNIISTIREQTGIRRKRNKFVLFDNHSLISDRFSFFFNYPINHNCILRYTRNIRHLIFSTFS